MDDEIGRTCGTNEEMRNACRALVRNPESVFLDTSSRISELYVQNKIHRV
jgi:hypothetical protein